MKINKEISVKIGIYTLCASLALITFVWAFGGRGYSVKPCDIVPARLAENTKLDLNKADMKELEALDGVGPIRAAKIIRYREKLGSFNNIEELSEIEGFKGKFLEKIKSRVKVEEK